MKIKNFRGKSLHSTMMAKVIGGRDGTRDYFTRKYQGYASRTDFIPLGLLPEAQLLDALLASGHSIVDVLENFGGHGFLDNIGYSGGRRGTRK